MVLIGFVQKLFFENLETKEVPNHVIRVSKQDLLKCNFINFHGKMKGVNLTCSKIDLSNLKWLSKFCQKYLFHFY